MLKSFPGVSPAENLTETTTHPTTFQLVPGSTAIVFVAVLECFIGICLLLNRWMRLAVWLLVAEAVGELSPLALVPNRLFSGPHHAPTLEGQYLLKDIVLVAAGMVIAATTFRGGRLTRDDPPPGGSKENDHHPHPPSVWRAHRLDRLDRRRLTISRLRQPTENHALMAPRFVARRSLNVNVPRRTTKAGGGRSHQFASSTA
ncbi:MAG: hypothetical protein ACR2OB_11570 [Solirubrobacteraceae bacterium]